MTGSDDLPLPGSPELEALVSNTATRAVYAFLYERRNDPPTTAEIRAHAAAVLGADQEHIGRRTRDLRRVFSIPAVRRNGVFVYELRGRASKGHEGVEARISKRVRAKVLGVGRCLMCGRSPRSDESVVLVVDHVIPQAWGGGDEIENLQPLCRDCNGGKQAWFGEHGGNEDEIKAAIKHTEPHRRIGELLKAFEGVPVRSDLIGIVASAGTFQEDWQKRLRELRLLGWEIKSSRRKVGPRFVSSYALLHSEPWPTDVPIRSAVKAEEQRRSLNKGGG